MKKFITLFMASVMVLSLSAQDGVIHKKLNAVKTDLKKVPVLKRKVISGTKSVNIPVGTPIGLTNYDLQTNSSSVDRLTVTDDGKVSAVWIQYQGTNLPNAPERGSGYAFYDGSSWQFNETSGNSTVEGSQRAGWPVLLSNGTSETVVSHYRSAGGLFGRTQTIGAAGSNWTTTDDLTGGPEAMLWPRGASSGDNYYVIAVDDYVSDPTTIDGLHLYTSTNAGSSWTYNGMMPNFSTYYNHGNGDIYAIDARDNYVAVVYFADYGDIHLWKSDDYGVTWAEKTIADFPVDAYNFTGGAIIDEDGDALADTIVSSDNAGDVIIDSNGKVHVIFSRMRYLDDDASDDGRFSYFPYTDWVLYWNEDMGEGAYSGSVTSPSFIDLQVPAAVDTIGWAPDLNNNGTLDFADVGTGNWPFGTYYTALSSFSTMGIDSGDTIYVLYSTVMEGDDYLKTNATPNAQQYRAVFLTKRDPGTGEWSDPVDVTSVDATLAENVFPVMSKTVGTDRNIHMFVQWDNEPGLKVRGDEDSGVTDNYIVYKALNLDGQAEGINKVNSVKFTIAPNPAVDYFRINALNLKKVEVYNIVGDKILTQYGENSDFVNTENMASGTYFVKVYTDKGSAVKKIIKK